MKKLWACFAMLTATMLWGTAFTAQSRGMEYLEPMNFVALRSIVGVFALTVGAICADLLRKRPPSVWGDNDKKVLLTGGILCGLVISTASVCQQFGLKYTSVGKTGFLTVLYIVIVPVLGVFFKRRASVGLWFAVALALLGSYLLCGGISGMGAGERFVILCSLIFATHILVIDRYAAKCDSIRLSCVQFSTAAVAAAAASCIAGENWNLELVWAAMPFWVFCGVGSSAVAFTLQIAAQKYLHPVAASLLMSLESVFAVLGGWIFLQERLSGREIAGGVVIAGAVILAQLPFTSGQKNG